MTGKDPRELRNAFRLILQQALACAADTFFLENEQGIIAYHWHPHSPGFIAPHLHLYAGARVGNAELRVAHIPTGRVALEDFVRMLITQFHVPARRKGWEQVLGDHQHRFEDD